MPIQVTTDLPDEDQPVLGNGVEDEIAVDRESAVSNYGDVRIQIRETGESAWDSSATGFAEFIGTFDTLTMEFVGREDGEEYEVRARTETEHVIGVWTTPVSIVTAFPSPSTASATVQDATTVALSWTDQADNESGFIVERRKEYETGWNDWKELADLPPDTESYTDDPAPPSATVQYRVTGYTPYSSATDETGPATTPSLGLPPRGVSADGIYVEIDHPDGTTVTPRIGNDSDINPVLNGRPEVTITVPHADHWLDEEWERQPMRVWRDGDRLPIERVGNVSTEPDHVEIVGTAGHELRQRFEADVQDESGHNVLRDVLAETGYGYTVDPAPAEMNEPWRTLSAETDFTEVARDYTELADPYTFDSGDVEPRQTCYLTAPETISSTKLVGDASVNWTASEAIRLDIPNGAATGWTINLEQRIPAEYLGITFRCALDMIGSADLFIDGTEVGYFFTSSRSNSKTVNWRGPNTTYNLTDLEPGEHTITLRPDDGGYADAEGYYYLDCPAIYDTRHWDSSQFSNQLNSNNRLEGPPGLYSTVDIDLNVTPISRATGGRLEATVDTENDQALSISPTDTEPSSFTTAANATTLETDFASSTRSFIARVTLGGYDASTSSTDVESGVTRYRTRPQTLSELTVKYDSLGSPTISELVDDPIEDVLNDKADRANLIWELQWDDDTDRIHVVVTAAGQRTSDADPDLADYSVTKGLEREISGATVYGRSQLVEGETFIADPGGTQLGHNHIKQDSERVADVDGSTTYERGDDQDYTMEYLIGFINAGDAQSSMTDGSEYQIDYEWLPQADVYRPALDFENHLIEELNVLTSDAACQQAAEFIVGELDGPQWEAEITISKQEAGFALTDVIAPSQLPSPPRSDGYEIKSVNESAGQISLTLGARLEPNEVIGKIENSLSQTSRSI